MEGRLENNGKGSLFFVAIVVFKYLFKFAPSCSNAGLPSSSPLILPSISEPPIREGKEFNPLTRLRFRNSVELDEGHPSVPV